MIFQVSCGNFFRRLFYAKLFRDLNGDFFIGMDANRGCLFSPNDKICLWNLRILISLCSAMDQGDLKSHVLCNFLLGEKSFKLDKRGV